MKKLFILSIFFMIIIFIAKIAQAEIPITQIQSILDKPTLLCGRFDQVKQLTDISKRLLSNGRFCIDAKKGILWQTLKPFPNTLRLTRDEIIQTQGNQIIMQMDAKQEPVVRMINNILFSLLAGDFSQLDKTFDLKSTIKNKNWQVNLKAHDPTIAKAIGEISLEGDNHVKHVIIKQDNGDSTSIVFSNIKNNPTLSKEEESLFE
jgi:hypothetical protein